MSDQPARRGYPTTIVTLICANRDCRVESFKGTVVVPLNACPVCHQSGREQEDQP